LAEKEREKKSWFTAVVLSLFFAGLGFAYLGHYRRFAMGLLSVLIAVFLTFTILEITGISPNTEVGRFVLFIVVFSSFAYLAYLTKLVCGKLQGEKPIKDNFNFWETKKPGKEKSKEAGQEKTKKGITPLGLVASAVIAMIVFFLTGPIEALIAFAIMLAVAYFGSI
jgi:hypothetical protein